MFLRPLESALADTTKLRHALRYLGAPVLIPASASTAAADLAAARAALLALTNIEEGAADEVITEAIEATWTAIDSVISLLQSDLELADDLPGQTAAALARIPHWLAIAWLEERTPSLLLGLRAIGAVDADGDSAREIFHHDRLEAFLEDPPGAIAALYAWAAGSEWEVQRLLTLLDRSAMALGWIPRWGKVPDAWVTSGWIDDHRSGFDDLRTLRLPLVGIKGSDGRILDEAGLRLGPIAQTPSGPLDSLFLGLWSDFRVPDLQLGGFAFDVPVDLDDPTIGVRFGPRGISTLAALPSALQLAVRYVDPVELADTLVLDGLRASIGIPSTGNDLLAEVAASVRWKIDMAGADAFVSDTLGSPTVEGALALSYSQSTGLTFDLGAGVELITTPTPTTGPLSLDALTLRLWVTADDVVAHALVDVTARLGIVSFTVAGTGIELNAPLTYPIAPVVTFVAPVGIGIVVGDEHTPVRGGGYLAIDPPRYSGAIELSFADIGVTAIGLLDVHGPGWSLVVSLSVDLPPILLPFGFQLNGIGGLLAWNRRVDVDVLREGLASGALDALLFPEDPVANATALLRQLDASFPRAEGQLTFGPVVQITWGVPTLLDMQLGVLVSLPEPVEIVLIGQLSAVLPTAEAPIVVLHLDVLGHIDLGAATISIDAELHDSYVVGLSLAGSMALRASFGEEPSFLLSFGGFHPAFQPPAELASMKRLTIGLDLGSAVEVSAKAYFAITSNTVQFGARVDVHADLSICSVDGGMGIDVLIQLSPFGFDARVDFYCSLKAGGWELAAVRLEGRFKGPKPWSVLGVATVKILGVKTEVRVEATLPSGASREQIPVETVNVAERIREALADASCWRSTVQSHGAVRLRAGLSDQATPPDGAIEVVQGVAPLGIVLERFGEYEPADPGPFEIEDPELSDGPAIEEIEDLTDWFAPGMFMDMTDDEKLGSPSFEKMRAGIRFGDDEPAAELGDQRSLVTDYEEIVWDPLVAEEPTRDHGAHLLDSTPGGVVVALASPVRITQPVYIVLDTSTGATVVAEISTHAEARRLAPAGAVVARRTAVAS